MEITQYSNTAQYGELNSKNVVEHITSILVVRWEMPCRLGLEFDDDTGVNSFESVTFDTRWWDRRDKHPLPDDVVVVGSIGGIDIFWWDDVKPLDISLPIFTGT